MRNRTATAPLPHVPLANPYAQYPIKPGHHHVFRWSAGLCAVCGAPYPTHAPPGDVYFVHNDAPDPREVERWETLGDTRRPLLVAPSSVKLIHG